MIALILGGAPSIFSEAEAAAALLGRRHMVVAANLAGIHWKGRLDGWATLHPDLLPSWAAKRAGEPAGRLFTPDQTPERWPGSSGLYALQCALFEMGATGAILCGVPMESEAGHFSVPGAWAGTDHYRQAFVAALPVIGARTRSKGGWTAELFGSPTPAWVEAVDNIKPLGVTRPPAEKTPMFNVKNVSKTTQSFWASDEQGVSRLYRVDPGKSVTANIDRAQPKFGKGGVFEVSAVAPAEPAQPEPAPKAKA